MNNNSITEHESENSTSTQDVNSIPITKSSECVSGTCENKSPVIEALSSFFKERRRLKEEAA